jgi:hypothetical protein
VDIVTVDFRNGTLGVTLFSLSKSQVPTLQVAMAFARQRRRRAWTILESCMDGKTSAEERRKIWIPRTGPDVTLW